MQDPAAGQLQAAKHFSFAAFVNIRAQEIYPVATYGFYRNIALSYLDAIELANAALEQEGFQVLARFDMDTMVPRQAATDPRPHTLLVACHPGLAGQALAVEPQSCLLLPCHVSVVDQGDGTSTVCVADPVQTFAMADNPGLLPVVDELNSRLWRVYLDLVTRSAQNPARPVPEPSCGFAAG